MRTQAISLDYARLGFCGTAGFVALVLNLALTYPVKAQVQCGDTVLENTTLNQDLDCGPDVGLIVRGPARLNLNGHTVTCECSVGIYLEGEGATLMNGRVIIQDDPTGVAVALQGDGRHRVSKMDVISAFFAIFISSPDNQLVNNTMSSRRCIQVTDTNENRLINNNAVNCIFGILVAGDFNRIIANDIGMSGEANLGIRVIGDDNKVRANRVDFNGGQAGVGIDLFLGAELNDIIGNEVAGSPQVDLRDSNENCDQNRWLANKFETANQECIR